MSISYDGKGSCFTLCFSFVQKPVCAEFSIKTEGNPGSGITETENGREVIPQEPSSKVAMWFLCCFPEPNNSVCTYGVSVGWGGQDITARRCFQLRNHLPAGQTSRPESWNHRSCRSQVSADGSHLTFPARGLQKLFFWTVENVKPSCLVPRLRSLHD